MKIFAASDHHFFHKNIIKYAGRPFDINDENCVLKNAELMINRHNEIVRNSDYVFMVGDLSAGLKHRTAAFEYIIKSLNGKKILIKGNHDHQSNDFYLNAGFIKVTEYVVAGDYFICHYPCYKSEFNKSREPWLINQLKKTNCTKIIHGHIHNKNPDLWKSDGYTRINVCVDFEPNNYYPQELMHQDIKKYIAEL